MRALIDYLAPLRCSGCDLELMGGQRGAFCAGCAVLLDPLTPKPCAAVGTAALFEYGGPMADAIGRYKYGARTDLAVRLGRLMADASLPWIGSVDVVVPVPLHWRRRLARGFNQASLLARPVARALRAKLCLSSLRRVRATRSQVGLSGVDRYKNVRGAFRARLRPEVRNVLLVDDVRTTGATLFECARELHCAGAESVKALALAQARL